MIGTITMLGPGGPWASYGAIASDAYGKPWKLGFRGGAVANDGFTRLRVGQRVRFDQVPLPGNPSRWHAVQVTPLA